MFCALALALALAAQTHPGCESEDACGPAAATVRRVVDGDTLDLDDGTRVRILGIDAPEAGSAPECGGLQAAGFLAGMLTGRRVTLSFDTECFDRYGRLLAHVRVGDESVGLALLDRGLACPVSVPPNLAYREAFERAAQVARARGLGLWGECRPLPCR
jgi:micrococcal nuclease